jgi:hypothetical protein
LDSARGVDKRIVNYQLFPLVAHIRLSTPAELSMILLTCGFLAVCRRRWGSLSLIPAGRTTMLSSTTTSPSDISALGMSPACNGQECRRAGIYQSPTPANEGLLTHQLCHLMTSGAFIRLCRASRGPRTAWPSGPYKPVKVDKCWCPMGAWWGKGRRTTKLILSSPRFV